MIDIRFILTAAVLAVPFLFWAALIINAAQKRFTSETVHQVVVLSTLLPLLVIYAILYILFLGMH